MIVMGNNKKLAKLGIIVTAVVIVFGVALFVFKGQENKVEPVENDFSVTRIQEDTPNEVGLIENESKFNEVETETVEDIEEIVDKAIEEIDKENSDHLEGITVHSKEDTENEDSVESEKADSEKAGSSKEDSEKADSSKDSSEKSDSKKGNNEQSDSSKSDSNTEKDSSEKSNSEKSDSTNTNSNSDKTSTGTTDNNGQVNNGEQNSTVQETVPSQPTTPVVVEQPTSQPELTDEYYANLAAQWGVEYIGDVSGASGPGTQGVGRLE